MMKMRNLGVLVAVFLLVVMLAPVGQKGNVWAQSAEFYLKRGLSYLEKGQLDPALADFTKALEINPRFAKAYSNRAIIYLTKG
jgi:Tfp pilus assembly protein PilF